MLTSHLLLALTFRDYTALNYDIFLLPFAFSAVYSV